MLALFKISALQFDDNPGIFKYKEEPKWLNLAEQVIEHESGNAASQELKVYIPLLIAV